MDTDIQNKEQTILIAAEEEFLLYGYDGAKTMSIAKRAGVTHAMLHYYYRTKLNLFNKILEEKMTILLSSFMNPFMNNDLPLIERILKGAEAHFDFLSKNPRLPRFVVNEIITKPEMLDLIKSRLQTFYQYMLPSLQYEIDEQVKSGKIHKIDFLNLIVDIVSLNVFPFIVLPILEPLIDKHYKEKQAFFEARKAENIKTIKMRLLLNQ
ncbi:MAG: TetR/AcrR family transcriptional regulator [Muribaculaceae bacterium]|nr:TetR/AcrR family transcriptional regulator [Muribaculaceae bacterium]